MGYRELGRTPDQHEAMLCDLATSLIVSGRIEATKTRARKAYSVVGKLIALGKKGDLTSRRNAAETLRNVEVLNEDETTQTTSRRLFGEIAECYAGRQGRYTRILKVGSRRDDGAESAIIELVG